MSGAEQSVVNLQRRTETGRASGVTLVTLLLLILPGGVDARQPGTSPRSVPLSTFDHQHAVWTAILQRHIQNDVAISRVNYRALRDDRTTLDSYLAGLSRVSREEFDAWTAQQRLAFLINAYNAFTSKLIVDNYPVDSIKDLGRWFSSPWKKRFFHLLGKQRSGRHRTRDDPKGLRRAPDPLCRELCGRFLRDSRRNRYDSEASVLELSSVLDWYRDDFSGDDRSLNDFLAPRMRDDPAIIEAIRNGSVRIRFLEYDWSLNDK